MVYIAKKGNEAVFHTDLQALRDFDGLEPDMTITEAKFEAAGSLARVIGGELVLGKTKAEVSAENATGCLLAGLKSLVFSLSVLFPRFMPDLA